MTGPLTEVDLDDLRRHERALNRWFDQEGVLRVDRLLPAAVEVDADDKRRYTVWLRDSLLWTVEELLGKGHDAGRRMVYAMRGYAQAKEYLGRVGWGDMIVNDTLGTLRAIIERALEPRHA